MKNNSVEILWPTVPEPDRDAGLKKEDVWGDPDDAEDEGMVKAWGDADHSVICPIWRETLPYKSVTVVCDEAQELEVIYWLEFVHGGGSVSKRKSLGRGKIALRSDYLAW